MKSKLISLVLGIVFLCLIYQEIFCQNDYGAIREAFLRQLDDGKNLVYLIFTVVLMPVNWGLETQKWLLLVRKIVPTGVGTAYRSVLAGVAFSLFTPNRIGEFGGRILYLDKVDHPRAILATLVGSVAQQIVLAAFGLVGFFNFLNTFAPIDKFLLNGIIFIAILFILLMVGAFINLNYVVGRWSLVFGRIVKRWFTATPRILQKIWRIIAETIGTYTKKELFGTLFWSLMRYTVYSVQYFLMLAFFGIHVSVIDGMSCIATIFLVQSSIPLPPIMGIIARGGIALKVWSFFGANAISILATTFTLWFINLIIPALIGLFFIINRKVFKSIKYEK
jgi:hypothetical protein